MEALNDTQEEIARQQSRNNTITLGERSTTFFHVTTLKRRKRNHIECIQDKDTNVVSTRSEIEEVFASYFSDLFIESPSTSDEHIFSHIKPCISMGENLELTSIPTAQEIWEVVKELKPNKAPGPDGFPVSFFKHNWGIVGPQLVSVITRLLHN